MLFLGDLHELLFILPMPLEKSLEQEQKDEQDRHRQERKNPEGFDQQPEGSHDQRNINQQEHNQAAQHRQHLPPIDRRGQRQVLRDIPWIGGIQRTFSSHEEAPFPQPLIAGATAECSKYHAAAGKARGCKGWTEQPVPRVALALHPGKQGGPDQFLLRRRQAAFLPSFPPTATMPRRPAGAGTDQIQPEDRS